MGGKEKEQVVNGTGESTGMEFKSTVKMGTEELQFEVAARLLPLSLPFPQHRPHRKKFVPARFTTQRLKSQQPAQERARAPHKFRRNLF